MDAETWDRTISVDLRGTSLVTRAVIPGMLDRGSGRVINVASQLGIKGAEEHTHYSAAKGGAIAFTRALAREVAPDVRVNATAPGPIETDLLNDTTEEWRENKKSELPLDRIGDVGDVVPTALLLAGEGGDSYTRSDAQSGRRRRDALSRECVRVGGAATGRPHRRRPSRRRTAPRWRPRRRGTAAS